MFDCNGDRIEEHQYDDKPIKPLRFDGVPDPKSKSLFSQPKTFATALIRHFWIEIAWNHVISVFRKHSDKTFYIFFFFN